MTKEPIMIDDVDVAECGFYCSAEENNYNCMLLNNIKNDCSYYKLCYYKQLKRKEQECEELKDLADHNGRVCNERLDKIDELEHNINKLMQQLDQLKAEIRNRNEKIEELRFSMSDLTNRLCNLNAEKSFRIVDYKQALQEIKEIAKPYSTMQYDNLDIVQVFDDLDQILQKCEEV
jgi:chromosome segregation ATPase